MKKKMVISFFTALLTVLGLYGIAICGGGGPEDPACMNLPEPKSGEFIHGTFTVSMDNSDCSQENNECKHFNVVVELKWNHHVHLYSFPATLGSGNLCAFSAKELKNKFSSRACTLKVGENFHLDGTPVISYLMITHQQCDDNLIKGELIIRVVP